MKLEEYSQSKLALGSDCTLCIVTDKPEVEVNELFNQLWQTIYQFERQFSRFIPGSELSAFNRSAGMKIAITPEFRDILQVAKRLSETTGGLYNPFILPALQHAGYTKSHVDQFKNDTQESYAERAVVSADHLIINDMTAEIPYGTAVDLGGCGKGYLADLLADSDLPSWVSGFWFSIGGDVAGGGSDKHGHPWQVVISDGQGQPSDESWHIQTTNQRFAAATSGTRIRTGVSKGKSWHHIIDPRTLEPATSDCYMATIYGQSAVTADALASCVIILGSAESPTFLKQQGITDALLQCHSSKKGDFYIQSGNAITMDDDSNVDYNHDNA